MRGTLCPTSTSGSATCKRWNRCAGSVLSCFERSVPWPARSELSMATETAQDRTAHAELEKKTPHVRVAIVGTGFSGLGLAIRLKQRGMENFVILERANDIGGTW